MSETIRFPVTGMTCVSCVARISRSIRSLDGVEKVHVDLDREVASVRRNPERVSNAALAAAVAAAGYRADMDAASVAHPPERHGGLLARLRRHG